MRLYKKHVAKGVTDGMKMRLIKQQLRLEVHNLNTGTSSRKVRHSALLPSSIRCIICGPSNCGKTNVILTLLLHENGLKFKNVYLYSKTTFQPKYKFLMKVLSRVPDITFHVFNNNEDVISPDDALPNSIIIFDDVACQSQIHIRNYFSMGRHKLIDCFYLTQTYSKVPKQLIRDNANLLIVFKQDDINLRHIYDEHVNTDVTWNQFKQLCSKVWEKEYNFLVINKDCSIKNGRYRQSFDTFVQFDN